MSDNTAMAAAAVDAVMKGEKAYCKFLSANDTGETGGHQSGIYIAKPAIGILFNTAGIKGENKDRHVKICWQNDFTTDSRFIYYGKGTRNEYRITRFGSAFPYLCPDHTGDMFVLVQMAVEDYCAYVLQTEDEINFFLEAFGMSPADTGTLIEKESVTPESHLNNAINKFIAALEVDFPSSAEMSAMARRLQLTVFDRQEEIIDNPDKKIVEWAEVEYTLFRRLEFARYGDMITKGFSSVEQFIEVANTVLNRRKSRAGKSLEHHLSAIFDGNGVQYESQVKTESNKKPDFIFPNGKAYHDTLWPSEKLIFLGAKTTCKDRWRQIINEANRISPKHLFTLQQGISTQQLNEMQEERIILVVPKIYLNTFPAEKRDSIWTLKKFIEYTKEKTSEL